MSEHLVKHRFTGDVVHGTEFYLASDVDALLRQREEELVRLKATTLTAENIACNYSYKLAAMTAELEEYRSIAETIGAEKAVSQLAQAQQQLAAMTVERDEAVRVAQGLTEPLPVTEQEAFDVVKHHCSCCLEIDQLQQQLAASQARRRQLEEALNGLAKCGCVDGNGVPFASCQGCNGTGDTRASSPPTERPPA